MVQMPKEVQAAESNEEVTMRAVMDRIVELYGRLPTPPCPWSGIRACDWEEAWSECLEKQDGLPTAEDILAMYHKQDDERHGSRVRPEGP